MILDCLHYWVQVMHVSTASASISPRCWRRNGDPLKDRPCSGKLNPIQCSPTARSSPRRGTPPGSTRSAAFAGHRWAEWNGRFRDDVRRFVKRRSGHGRRVARARPAVRHLPSHGRVPHQQHQLRHLPRRLHAQRSRLLQRASTTRPTARTTATASTTTCSWNCGVEGRPTIPAIERLRHRQIKNFLPPSCCSHRACR